MNAAESPTRLNDFMQATVGFLLRNFWGLRVDGLEGVPPEGRLIVAHNHVHWLDPVAIAVALDPVRYPRFIAKQELFKNRFVTWFFRNNGVVPLDRGHGDVGAIRWVLSVLRQEGCVVVAPEGTRSRTGAPLRPKPGIGFMAYHAAAPVLPARLRDTEKFPGRAKLRVSFGPLLRFQGKAERADCQAFADRVMEAIFKL